MAWAAGLLAQLDPAPTTLEEEIDVRLVDVDVWVSDRVGRPVPDLTSDDFRVVINGQPVAISHFAPPKDSTERRPLQLAIYVDASNVDPRRRREALEHLRAFISTQLDEGDRILLAVGDAMGLRPLHALDDSHNEIGKALEDVATLAVEDRRASEFRDILRDIETALTTGGGYGNASLSGLVQGLEARILAFGAESSRDTARIAANLERIVDTMAGLPGRKALLYLGGGLALRPSEALHNALTQAVGRFAGPSASGWEPSLRLPAGSSEDDSAGLVALGQRASQRGVTFFAAALDAPEGSSAIGLTRGSSRISGGSAPGQEDTWAPTVRFSRRGDLDSSLQLLAAATGGYALGERRDLGWLLERIAEDNAYSLGLAPPSAAPTEGYRLEIEVRGRGREVRHRRSFRVRGADNTLHARTLSALLADRAPDEAPLKLQLETGEAQALGKDHFTVPLSIQVPIEELAIAPQGQAHRGQVSIFVAVGDGTFVDGPVRKAVFPVVLDNSQLLEAMGRMADFNLELPMRRGRGKIAVGLHDDLATVFATQTLDLVVGSTTP